MTVGVRTEGVEIAALQPDEDDRRDYKLAGQLAEPALLDIPARILRNG